MLWDSKFKITTGLVILTLIICLGLRFSGPLKRGLLVIERVGNQLATVVLTHSFKSVSDLKTRIDVTIHLHLNDYARLSASRPGKYSGFSIYVPVNQYGNSPTTKAVAQNIFNRLAKYNSVSDLSGESTGLVEEPDLIAIGTKNSSNAASLLIEYGYIYEPQFTNPQLCDVALKDLAWQTYLGLQDFFEPNSTVRLTKADDTLLLPYDWNRSLKSQDKSVAKDIFVLQTALMLEGEYPPVGKSKNDCPRTGFFGPCTKSALLAFQTKQSINGENDLVGEKTIAILKQLY